MGSSLSAVESAPFRAGQDRFVVWRAKKLESIQQQQQALVTCSDSSRSPSESHELLLPVEILLQIFNELRVVDLMRCARVCRTFRVVAHDRTLRVKFSESTITNEVLQHIMSPFPFERLMDAATQSIDAITVGQQLFDSLLTCGFVLVCIPDQYDVSLSAAERALERYFKCTGSVAVPRGIQLHWNQLAVPWLGATADEARSVRQLFASMHQLAIWLLTLLAPVLCKPGHSHAMLQCAEPQLPNVWSASSACTLTALHNGMSASNSWDLEAGLFRVLSVSYTDERQLLNVPRCGPILARALSGAGRHLLVMPGVALCRIAASLVPMRLVNGLVPNRTHWHYSLMPRPAAVMSSDTLQTRMDRMRGFGSWRPPIQFDDLANKPPDSRTFEQRRMDSLPIWRRYL